MSYTGKSRSYVCKRLEFFCIKTGFSGCIALTYVLVSSKDNVHAVLVEEILQAVLVDNGNALSEDAFIEDACKDGEIKREFD